MSLEDNLQFVESIVLSVLHRTDFFIVSGYLEVQGFQNPEDSEESETLENLKFLRLWKSQNFEDSEILEIQGFYKS